MPLAEVQAVAAKESAKYISELAKRMIQHIETVVIGKRPMISSALIAPLLKRRLRR